MVRMKKTTKKVARKAGIQPGSKKFPKILAVPASEEEFQAAYNFTPAEIRRVTRILESVRKRKPAAAK
jgi:hypothetical protein